MMMGGSMTNMGRVEYSQGVRQAIQRLHINETGFVLGGKFTLDDLRNSRFCLCPSGWGWGWRIAWAGGSGWLGHGAQAALLCGFSLWL